MNKQQSATGEFRVEGVIRHTSLKNNSGCEVSPTLLICMPNRPTSLTKPSQTRSLCSNNCDETHTIRHHRARQWPSSSSCEAMAVVFINCVQGKSHRLHRARQRPSSLLCEAMSRRPKMLCEAMAVVTTLRGNGLRLHCAGQWRSSSSLACKVSSLSYISSIFA